MLVAVYNEAGTSTPLMQSIADCFAEHAIDVEVNDYPRTVGRSYDGPIGSTGWSPLIEADNTGAVPRVNANKFPPNIHSGQRSQEISFDFRNVRWASGT